MSTFVVLAWDKQGQKIIFYLESESLRDAQDSAAEIPRISEIIQVQEITNHARHV